MSASRMQPWAMKLVTNRGPMAQSDYAFVAVDRDSQIGVFTDEYGNIAELAKHGTNKESVTASYSGGGDGSKPQPQVSDDSTVDYSSD